MAKSQIASDSLETVVPKVTDKFADVMVVGQLFHGLSAHIIQLESKVDLNTRLAAESIQA